VIQLTAFFPRLRETVFRFGQRFRMLVIPPDGILALPIVF